MIQTPVDIVSNRCFICEGRGVNPCPPAPSPPHLDVQSSDAETIVAEELLEDVGLAPVEAPRHMIPQHFTAEYRLRGCASLDVFEELQVQATYLPFMPANYVHWLNYSIPLSRFFFLDAKWISWGDARVLDQDYQEQCGGWGAEEGGPSTDNESLDAQADCSYDPRLSSSEESSGVSLGLFSIPSMEDIRRRRTIYYPQPPLIRTNTAVGNEFGRVKWQSTSSLSSASGTSRLTRTKIEDIQERFGKVFHDTS